MLIKICKNCTDPTYCQSIIHECEIDAVDRLEDVRQSDGFDELFLDDKKYEEDQDRQEFNDQFEED